MHAVGLPLKLGSQGTPVLDLHRRLAEAGFAPANLLSPVFGADTDDAVRAFQESRRIEVDGVVGRHTWAALAEAAHRLGDRLLYQKQSPMLRGDDVAELQQRLGSLGFDAGRVDGIFGPETARALETFQRNAGLPSDGIFGPATHDSLTRLGGRAEQQSVASVRERERLRAVEDADSTVEPRVVIGELGGLGAVVDTCLRYLRHQGVRVETITHPEEGHHARLCNDLEVTGYLGIVAGAEQRCTVSYFATTGFESPGGRHLAELVSDELAKIGFDDATAMGQRLPVLRETRMPAVVVRIGPPARLVQAAPDLADALATAVPAWLLAPAGPAEEPR